MSEMLEDDNDTQLRLDEVQVRKGNDLLRVKSCSQAISSRWCFWLLDGDTAAAIGGITLLGPQRVLVHEGVTLR